MYALHRCSPSIADSSSRCGEGKGLCTFFCSGEGGEPSAERASVCLPALPSFSSITIQHTAVQQQQWPTPLLCNRLPARTRPARMPFTNANGSEPNGVASSTSNAASSQEWAEMHAKAAHFIGKYAQSGLLQASYRSGLILVLSCARFLQAETASRLHPPARSQTG